MTVRTYKREQERKSAQARRNEEQALVRVRSLGWGNAFRTYALETQPFLWIFVKLSVTWASHFVNADISTACKIMDMHKRIIKISCWYTDFLCSTHKSPARKKNPAQCQTPEVVFAFFTGRTHQSPSVGCWQYNIPTALLKLSAVSFLANLWKPLFLFFGLGNWFLPQCPAQRQHNRQSREWGRLSYLPRRWGFGTAWPSFVRHPPAFRYCQ